MATRTILLTSGSSWQVPSDIDTRFPAVLRTYGGGGGGQRPAVSTGGGAGGGGGAYASSSIILFPFATVFYNIGGGGAGGATSGASGASGGDTWINTVANSAPASAANGALAKGGSGASSGTGGAGGLSASSVGTTVQAGGNGGNSANPFANGAGGGGGASGNDLAVSHAGANTASNTGAGGGGAGGPGSGSGVGGLSYTGGAGGTTTGGAAGGAGINGAGGGGGSPTGGPWPGGAGGNGTELTDYLGATAGSGGGGGGGSGSTSGGAGANGGLYGGGGAGGGYGTTTTGNGGNGAQGLVAITFTVQEEIAFLPFFALPAFLPAAVNPFLSYALALPFKTGDTDGYWLNGTSYAAISSVPGYSYTRSGQVSFVNNNSPLGANLVANGDASNGIVGWSASTTGILSNVGGRFRVVETAGNDYAYQMVPTVVGQAYTFTGSTFSGTNALPRLRVGTSALAQDYYTSDGSSGTFTKTFVATTTTTYITLFSQPNSAGGYDEYDNISLQPVQSVISDFAANAPPILPTIGYEAYGALTNYILNSNAIDAASWTKANATVVANNATAPDGTSTADTLTMTGAVGNNLYAQATVALTVGQVVTASVWMRAATATQVDMRFNGVTAISNNESAGTHPKSVTSTFQRFVRTFTVVANDSALFLIFEPQAGSVVEFWGAQVLVGNFPDGGPIIATAGASASIGAGSLSVTVPNGSYSAVYTFDDNSTQTIPTTVSGGVFTLANYPTLNRPTVKQVTMS